MKIAVDARELEGRRTGVGRYLHELLREFATDPQARTHEFVLCSTTPIDMMPYQGLAIRNASESGRGVLWEQVTLPRILQRERPHLLFAPGYTAPLRTSTPTVLVVHDVSFCSHPDWFSWREGARRRTITRLASRRAARVITVSRFSKGEIEAYLGVSPSQIVVIPNGVTRMTRAPIKAHTGVHTVLYAGSILNRRHVPTLIDAIALLVNKGLDVRLEIVGDNRTRPYVDIADYARAASVSDRVAIRAYVTDTELSESYSRARVFAFLSEYEGFGLTPLEALSAGIPIVVLDRPTTREIYGDAATFVADPTADAVASGLERALLDETERRRILDSATDVLRRYAWKTSAARLLELFTDVARERRTSDVVV